MFIKRFFSTSSCHYTKAWMAKHVSDPYVRRSVKENYRARSAFKLIEMNNMYKFLEPGHIVIDMGAAPGAWSQVLVKQVNARVKIGKRTQQQNELLHPSEITSLHKPNPDFKCGIVIALDRDPIFEIPGVHIIDDWNLTEETTGDCNKRLKDLLKDLKVDKIDGILSDMCPNVSGCKAIDHSGENYKEKKDLHFFV
jgi:23S rRNA (uridine2552-2'-O)-methyltransferase